MPLRFVSAAFLGIVAIAVAECAQIVGVLLVFTLMVGPAAAAMNLHAPASARRRALRRARARRSLGRPDVAFYTDWPTSFWITALSGMVFFGAAAARRIRGVAAAGPRPGRPWPARRIRRLPCRMGEGGLTTASLSLDVESSALGRPWRPRLDGAGETRALAIAQVGGQDELIARVLAGRGVDPEAVERYLDPTLARPDARSLRLRDMEAATDGSRVRSSAASGSRSSATTTSTAPPAPRCSSEYLVACGCETIVHIPDRVTEGYGPNVEAIAGFAAQGATPRRHRRLRRGQPRAVRSGEPARPRRDRVRSPPGARSCLPTALALVDPNRQDDLSGLGYLCAAGVVFMALVALNRALREAGFWSGRAPRI